MDLWPLLFALLVAFFIVFLLDIARRPASKTKDIIAHRPALKTKDVDLRVQDSMLEALEDGSPIALIEGPGRFELEIVGESHYQAALNKLAGGKTEEGHRIERKAVLFLDDENPHDDKAVAVLIKGELVGYLDRETARSYRQQMAVAGHRDSTPVAEVAALIVGGWSRQGDEGHYGVKLDIPIEEPEAPDVGEQERLFIAMVEETEADDARNGWGVAPGWYQKLAILYRKQKRYDEEVAILERYEAQRKAPGALPKKLAERLIKARAIRDRNRAD